MHKGSASGRSQPGLSSIRGHVLRSFHALVLQGEPRRRVQVASIEAEWAANCRDPNARTETGIEPDGKRFRVRRARQGSIAAIPRCAGARLPHATRR